jgi:hypothetical protein
MQDATRMTEDAKEQASRTDESVEAGFEAASRSFAEATRGFQAIAAEINDFSRRRFEDVLQSWQQFLSARSFGDVVEVHTRYAQRAHDAYMSEMSKLGEMYLSAARNATKPVAQSAKRHT